MPAQPIAARGLADGREVWRGTIIAELTAAAGDGAFYVSSGDTLHALAQDTGETKWSVRAGALAAPPVWQSGWVFIATSDGTIQGLRANNGSRVWTQPLGSPVSANIAIDGARLFAPLQDKRLVALHIPSNGNLLWSADLGGVGTEPLAADNRVFLSTKDNRFLALRQDTGKPHWPAHALIRVATAGRPEIDQHHIYVATLDGRGLALDRESGSVKWHAPLQARPVAQLVIDNEQLLIPLNSGDIAVLPIKNGTPVTAIMPKMASGHRLLPPLLTAGTPASRQLLRLTLGPDAVQTLTSFTRVAPPVPAPPVK